MIANCSTEPLIKRGLRGVLKWFKLVKNWHYDKTNLRIDLVFALQNDIYKGKFTGGLALIVPHDHC